MREGARDVLEGAMDRRSSMWISSWKLSLRVACDLERLPDFRVAWEMEEPGEGDRSRILSHSRTEAGASESRLVCTDSFTDIVREDGGASSSLVVVVPVCVSR